MAELLKLKNLSDKQGDKFKWFAFYTMVNERLKAILTTTNINLNDYPLTDKLNKKATLTLNNAEYYTLDFWFLACPPCIKDYIYIKKSISNLKNKKIELIGISTDENLEKWKEYLKKHDYNWRNYLEGIDNTLTNKLSINSFPTYVIIDNKGNIKGTFNSFSDILKKYKIKE